MFTVVIFVVVAHVLKVIVSKQAYQLPLLLGITSSWNVEYEHRANII